MDVGATRARARAGCRSAALLALVSCQVTLRLDGYDFGGSGGSGGDSSTSTLQPGRAGGDASPTAPPTDATDATDASDVPSNTGAMPPDAADVPPSAGDVPRNSLGLWFLADDGVIAQPDGSISTWSDRSGNGQDASQPVLAQRPTLELRDDGMPMVSFDGTNDSFVLPPGFAAFDGASFF